MYEAEKDKILNDYYNAKEIYAKFDIDTDEVLDKMKKIRISLHCWQGDDVTGFEKSANGLSGGGILATGNWPGRARNGEELRQDIEKALSRIPGKHKVNLHAIYAETNGEFVDRDEINVEHFRKWVDWAKENGLGLDFNPTFFSHPKANDGYTLSSKDENIRKFWIEHGKRCREIANEIGKELKIQCVNNIWIPDGSKDLPANRIEHRKILKESLDEIFSVKYDKTNIIDSVESKLFGIGSESYVVGSHEFYMNYASRNDVMLCLDMGHFHPTESIADKISSILTFDDNLLVHVSRGVRWDSDHVVILNEDLLSLAKEIRRCNAYDKVYIALDFFDASINRIMAWVIGARATLKAILISLLEPVHLLLEEENKGNFGARLALMEEFKTLPFYSVWNKYCMDENVPIGTSWIDAVKEYEKEIIKNRT
ncbi:L-rhamnose isomerase [Thermoanaerobacterium xylanolyticum LX-11]|uniref:L-rhamnose isomerase n=1 Tax=Thermoanaerobacterium xylanolyticum (strain ATCC 49914 / DSM 7097 / LX-11) TaxID=858215 RepID=F6BKE7_THEXL|nr:L-rhamnose isomerase [Thermoanaerobacterium xylanolyticum]AEF18094.1 L-rhamnose isomerase [Thermoanaerobacterium xylanolyticum LX-11]